MANPFNLQSQRLHTDYDEDLFILLLEVLVKEKKMKITINCAVEGVTVDVASTEYGRAETYHWNEFINLLFDMVGAEKI